MLAFHNDAAFKQQVLGHIIAHREADKLVHGQYWRNGKGCAVGCTLESVRLAKNLTVIGHDAHALYETKLGIPQVLARLEDHIFESLPNEVSQGWPERFISAIAPGADLDRVWPRFAFWLLTEELPQYDGGRADVAAALKNVGDLYRTWIDTGHPGAADAARADRAAWAAGAVRTAMAAGAARAARADRAAAEAAWAAATAAAAVGAAGAAAGAAEAAAARAAEAAAEAAAARAARAARAAAWARQADKLIELLQAAPIAQQAA